jgi:hypothetical protein
VHARSPRTRGETRDDVAARRPSLLPSLTFERRRLPSSRPSRTIIPGAYILIGDERSTCRPSRRLSRRDPVLRLELRLKCSPPFRRGPPRRSGILPDRSSFLSWVCPKIAPPSYCPLGSPLPETIHPVARPYDLLRNATATSRSCSDLVVLPTSPVSSSRPGTRMLQRASDPGVHHVSADATSSSGSSRIERPGTITLPRDAFLPFEAFPPCTAAGYSPCEDSPTGARHHLDSHLPRCSPTSLPSRRCHRSRFWEVAFPFPGAASRPQGLAPCPGPLSPRPLPAAGNPVLPWA